LLCNKHLQLAVQQAALVLQLLMLAMDLCMVLR
jgi:hypothetical protein